jgi:glycosyltransferase involved in cell wall biosynthesis
MENKPKLHVVHLVSYHGVVPYLNWFAERVQNYPDVKFTIISLYHEKSPMLEDMRIRGCDCYWIKYDIRYRKPWMVYAFFKLYALLKKLKPDVVCAHLFDDSLVGLLAARFTGIKKRVIRKQDTAYRWYYRRFWVWGDFFNNRNATDIIAISAESEKFLLEKEKAPAKKMHLIHNGFPISQFTAQTDKEKQDFINRYQLKDKIVIGSVARYIEWKGYRYIIEAAKTLVKKYPNLKFLFVGQGPQREELEILVKQNALEEYIVFTGFIEPSHIPSLYGIFTIFLHAAFMEPFGYVIAEAMANGVPIVTSKTGIAAEVLEHKATCYFTGYKDPEGIIAGVDWMLENPETRESMKDKIKKIANEKFSIELMLDKHIKIFKGLG